VANDGFHPPIEEYLEALHEMAEENQDLVQVRLAERLGHQPASVSEMIKRLSALDYVQVVGRTIVMTEAGHAIAHRVVRKHRLAERLLTDVIGMEWHLVHEEACRWEHVISDEVEAKLITLLGSPQTCPHGNPIPGLYQSDEQLVALSEIEVGQQVTVKRVTESIEIDEALLGYFAQHNIKPLSQLVIDARDDTGTLQVRCTPDSDFTNSLQATLAGASARAVFVSLS